MNSRNNTGMSGLGGGFRGISKTFGGGFSDAQRTPEPLEIEEQQISVKKNSVDEGSVVDVLSYIFEQSVKLKASDIHFEPMEDELRVRVRVDGILRQIANYSADLQSGIVSRIKILADMNIAEKRIPQDGRIKQTINEREIDFRVSTLPTVLGEKIVMRIQDRSEAIFDLSRMGFSDENFTIYKKLIKKPYGMLLVTGPTGSGKSTTMYASINTLNDSGKNFVTVEDPVEFQVDGISQVNVNIAAGMTFAKALRAILRQDPNVVMIGEIRDKETADIAVRAALTGHFVLSTLHTNDAASTITRLTDMGIEPFLVSTAIVGVVSQRLVRRICTACKEEYTLEPNALEREFIGVSDDETVRLFRGRGCRQCNNIGYTGRIAIHEILSLDAQLRQMINNGASVADISGEAIKNGMITMRQDGINKAFSGITTIDEVIRVSVL